MPPSTNLEAPHIPFKLDKCCHDQTVIDRPSDSQMLVALDCEQERFDAYGFYTERSRECENNHTWVRRPLSDHARVWRLPRVTPPSNGSCLARAPKHCGWIVHTLRPTVLHVCPRARVSRRTLPGRADALWTRVRCPYNPSFSFSSAATTSLLLPTC